MYTVRTLLIQCKHQNYFNDVNWLKKRQLISGSLAGAIIQWYCTTLIDVLLHCTWDKKLLWTVLVFTIKQSKTNQRGKTFGAAILITSLTQKKAKQSILSRWKFVKKNQRSTYIIQGGDWCTLPTIVLLSVHVKNFLSIHRHKPTENTFLKV